MATTTREFTFDPNHLATAVRRVNAVNRRIERHGLTPYTYTHRLETVPVHDDETGAPLGYAEEVIFTIEGETPAYDARRIVAAFLRERCNERTVPAKLRREGILLAADWIDPDSPAKP